MRHGDRQSIGVPLTGPIAGHYFIIGGEESVREPRTTEDDTLFFSGFFLFSFNSFSLSPRDLTKLLLSSYSTYL